MRTNEEPSLRVINVVPKTIGAPNVVNDSMNNLIKDKEWLVVSTKCVAIM